MNLSQHTLVTEMEMVAWLHCKTVIILSLSVVWYKLIFASSRGTQNKGSGEGQIWPWRRRPIEYKQQGKSGKTSIDSHPILSSTSLRVTLLWRETFCKPVLMYEWRYNVPITLFYLQKKNTVLHRGKSKDQGDDGNKIRWITFSVYFCLYLKVLFYFP